MNKLILDIKKNCNIEILPSGMGAKHLLSIPSINNLKKYINSNILMERILFH